MKSPVHDFKDIVCLGARNSKVLLDFGCFLLGPQLKCIPLCQYVGGNSLPGSKKVRVMFNDIVQAANVGTPGTVDWTPLRVVGSETMNVVRMKAYPCYVHWLKANFPISMFDVPRTVFVGKQSVSQMSRVVGKMTQLPEDLIHHISCLRVEITVSCNVEHLDLLDVAQRVLPDFCRQVFRQFEVVPIPLDLIATNARDWLDVAILNHLTHGRNSRKLNKNKVSYICHIMNEIGISTDSVCSNLKRRYLSGRYQFDLFFPLPAATLPMPQIVVEEHEDVAEVYICCNVYITR